MGWLMKNKLKVGGTIMLLAQGLRLWPECPHVVLEIVQFGAAIFGGSGVLPSDAAVKEFGDEAK